MRRAAPRRRIGDAPQIVRCDEAVAAESVKTSVGASKEAQMNLMARFEARELRLS
jgi:hypothetical protein